MRRYGALHRLVVRQLRVRPIQAMHRHEQVDGSLRIDRESQVKLVHRLQLGDLEEQAPLIGKDVRALDGDDVVTARSRMARRELRRTIRTAVAIVPCLGKLASWPDREALVDWFGEAEQDAVLV